MIRLRYRWIKQQLIRWVEVVKVSLDLTGKILILIEED